MSIPPKLTRSQIETFKFIAGPDNVISEDEFLRNTNNLEFQTKQEQENTIIYRAVREIQNFRPDDARHRIFKPDYPHASLCDKSILNVIIDSIPKPTSAFKTFKEDGYADNTEKARTATYHTLAGEDGELTIDDFAEKEFVLDPISVKQYEAIERRLSAEIDQTIAPALAWISNNETPPVNVLQTEGFYTSASDGGTSEFKYTAALAIKHGVPDNKAAAFAALIQSPEDVRKYLNVSVKHGFTAKNEALKNLEIDPNALTARQEDLFDKLDVNDTRYDSRWAYTEDDQLNWLEFAPAFISGKITTNLEAASDLTRWLPVRGTAWVKSILSLAAAEFAKLDINKDDHISRDEFAESNVRKGNPSPLVQYPVGNYWHTIEKGREPMSEASFIELYMNGGVKDRLYNQTKNSLEPKALENRAKAIWAEITQGKTNDDGTVDLYKLYEILK